MSSDALERVLSCPNLPSLPSVAVQILELTQDSDVSLRDIAKVVEQDQALTGKILRTVNSSFYGLAQPCGTVDRALNYLGLNTVKSLVLGFSLVESTSGVGEGTDFSLEKYWSRTIYTATAARILALQFRRTDPDEAFTAALFQDIGVLAAVTALKDEYVGPLGDDLFSPHLQALEKETVEFTHTQVGAALAEKWRLPQAYIDVIQYHHDPEGTPANAQQVVRIAVLGRVASDVLTGGKTSKASLRKFEKYSSEWYGQGFKEAELQFEEIAKAAKEVGKLFEQKVEQATNIGALMSEAQDRAIEVQFSSEQESFRDGLTGISNRKHFDTQGERMFEEARAAGAPIAILFCDGDRFKSVNDTLGHQAGDAVLVEMAKRISEVVGDSGEAFRYGGEEFSIVLPGLDMDQAAEVAERIRAAMESSPVDLSSVDCQVDEHVQTLSFGVAAGVPGTSHALENLLSLVKAADDAVYLAKENGRNRVEKAAIEEIEEAAPVVEQSPAPVPAAPKKAPSSGTTRILLVEDDPLSATLWRTMLAKTSGVEVSQATGRRGVDKLLKSGYEPDVVVTDYMLGSGTGVDVIIAVRKALGQAVPILLISAQLDLEREEAALAAGATVCVSKTDICKRFKFWIELVVSGDFDKKSIAG
jgi:diguanylate cyclase (GGDEF)-like protein/putative nucleotidyltransferase with HDIG domain